MAVPKRKWTGRTGGSAFGQKAMKIMFSILDVRIGYVILAFIVPFYMLFARRGYLAIYHYFRLRQGYSPMKSFLKTYKNHFLFGQMIIDRFAIYAGKKCFRIDNPDNNLFMDMVKGQRGFIIASSHVGNPELCGYMLSQNIKRINSLIFGGEAREVQKNRMKILEENNVRIITTGADMSHIFLINDALQNGEILTMLCDRVFGSGKTVECDFMNGKADFPAGAFALAMQFDVPVIALFVMKTSMLRYRIHVIPVLPPPQSDSQRDSSQDGSRNNSRDTSRDAMYGMARNFAFTLENILKQYPEQWFNFYEFWK